MKIFVLNGSPKRTQSNTLLITNAFLDGIRAEIGESANIEILDIYGAHIVNYSPNAFVEMADANWDIVDTQKILTQAEKQLDASNCSSFLSELWIDVASLLFYPYSINSSLLKRRL